MGAPSNLEPESPVSGVDLLAASSPGTSEFFGSLYAYVQDLAPGLPINRVVLQSVLLCILAGNRSLVLRTREEDVALLANTTAYLLGSPLAYTTHRARIAPAAQHTPESLISSLFLSTNKLRLKKARRGSAVRSRTFPPPQPSPTVAAARLPALADLSDADSQRPNSSHSSQFTRPPLRGIAQHALSDSAADVSSVCSTRGEPPQALVLSGLEYTSAPCQRALLEVFQDGYVAAEYIGDGTGTPVPLPEGFICVYVCPFDPYERPAIHQNLLDKFALSATVLLTPALRETYTSYLGAALPPPPPPALGTSLLHRILMRLQQLSTLQHTHLSDTAGLFLTRLFSAARHHPELDAALLGARAHQDGEALARALRVLCGGERVGALVQRVAAAIDADDYDGDTDLASTIDSVGIGAAGGRQVHLVLEPEHASALSSPRRSGSEDKSHRPPSGLAPPPDLLVDMTSAMQKEHSLPAWLAGENADASLCWDLSEADIGTIAPRVLSHRLRMREGPADEILASVVYHACGPTDPERGLTKGVWKRRTVKDVLVQLFKEV